MVPALNLTKLLLLLLLLLLSLLLLLTLMVPHSVCVFVRAVCVCARARACCMRGCKILSVYNLLCSHNYTHRQTDTHTHTHTHTPFSSKWLMTRGLLVEEEYANTEMGMHQVLLFFSFFPLHVNWLLIVLFYYYCYYYYFYYYCYYY